MQELWPKPTPLITYHRPGMQKESSWLDHKMYEEYTNVLLTIMSTNNHFTQRGENMCGLLLLIEIFVYKRTLVRSRS